jgi:hypothetical protein
MKFGPTYLWHFEGDIFVRCPHCGHRAHLRRRDDDSGSRLGYRFVCETCGRANDWSFERDNRIFVPAASPHLNGFGLDLWLQTPCCGETLWAFNELHIEFMERFIAAKLRERDLIAWGVGLAQCVSREPLAALDASRQESRVSLEIAQDTARADEAAHLTSR